MTAAVPRAKKRAKKDNIVVLEQAARAAEEKVKEDNSFELGGRTWHVNPIMDRGTEEAYDQSADFFEAAFPLIQKIFSSIVSASAVAGEGGVNFKGKSMIEQIGYMIDIAQDLDLLSIHRDLREVMPRMGQIICAGEDASVTESDIRKWAGSPLNPNLLNAVIMQIGADGIIPNVLQLGSLFMGGGEEKAEEDNEE